MGITRKIRVLMITFAVATAGIVSAFADDDEAAECRNGSAIACWGLSMTLVGVGKRTEALEILRSSTNGCAKDDEEFRAFCKVEEAEIVGNTSPEGRALLSAACSADGFMACKELESQGFRPPKSSEEAERDFIEKPGKKLVQDMDDYLAAERERLGPPPSAPGFLENLSDALAGAASQRDLIDDAKNETLRNINRVQQANAQRQAGQARQAPQPTQAQRTLQALQAREAAVQQARNLAAAGRQAAPPDPFDQLIGGMGSNASRQAEQARQAEQQRQAEQRRREEQDSWDKLLAGIRPPAQNSSGKPSAEVQPPAQDQPWDKLLAGIQPPAGTRPPAKQSTARYGALALTPSGGWGCSYNEFSQNNADQTAMQSCIAASNYGCSIVIRFGSGQCVALFQNFEKVTAYAWGSESSGVLQDRAMRECESKRQGQGTFCSYKFALCNDPAPR